MTSMLTAPNRIASQTPSGRKPRRKESGPIVLIFKIVLFIVYGVPILWIIVTSFKEPGDVFSSQAMFVFNPTLDAYRNALTDGSLLEAGVQSFIIAAGTTVLTSLIAIPAGYGLARVGGRITTICLGLVIVLQMMPQTATVIPLFQIFASWGLLDQRLGVIMADTALLTPFAILLLRPFFRAVPTALEEAASLDGASSWRTFQSVVLPIARNGVATTGTLVFLHAWGEFLYAVNFFLSPGTYPLSALLAQQISEYATNWPSLMALSVVTSIPVLVLFVWTYRLLREGLTLGAVK